MAGLNVFSSVSSILIILRSFVFDFSSVISLHSYADFVTFGSAGCWYIFGRDFNGLRGGPTVGPYNISPRK